MNWRRWAWGRCTGHWWRSCHRVLEAGISESTLLLFCIDIFLSPYQRIELFRRIFNRHWGIRRLLSACPPPSEPESQHTHHLSEEHPWNRVTLHKLRTIDSHEELRKHLWPEGRGGWSSSVSHQLTPRSWCQPTLLTGCWNSQTQASSLRGRSGWVAIPLPCCQIIWRKRGRLFN